VGLGTFLERFQLGCRAEKARFDAAPGKFKKVAKFD
jgi:hypothetical protein